MNREDLGVPEYYFLPAEQLDLLYQQLYVEGYTVHAPQVVEGAISYVESMSSETLPRGVSDQQQPGRYRLQDSGDSGYFGWSSALQGIKSLLFPPEQPLWHSLRQEGGELQFEMAPAGYGAVALLGARSCDLAAIELMDRHFLRSDAEDPWYRQRRDNLLLISVDCRHAAESCFCVSTGTGPVAQRGFDLRLVELESGYLVKAGSEHGEQLLQPLGLPAGNVAQLDEMAEQQRKVVAQQQRTIASSDFRPHFSRQKESPVWEEIAARCLGCGNCTAVCPTCFCHREEEVATLDLNESIHQRVWDSCFSDRHSELHGIPVRTGRRERYRQWMTHKLGGWHDQFGESGCVGCGRCITWCPVGIDLVKESGRFVEVEDE